MSEMTVDAVRAFVLDQIAGTMQAGNIAPEEIDDDTDLLAEGFVDSLGVLELIAAVSDRFGVEGDWEDYEPDDILVVGPFCRYTVSHARIIRAGEESAPSESRSAPASRREESLDHPSSRDPT